MSVFNFRGPLALSDRPALNCTLKLGSEDETALQSPRDIFDAISVYFRSIKIRPLKLKMIIMSLIITYISTKPNNLSQTEGSNNLD